MGAAADIYLVEDDVYYNKVLRKEFEKNHYAVKAFTNSSDYLKAIDQQIPSLVILDYEIDQKNGIDLLIATKAKNATAKVIMMSSLEKQEIINEAGKQGAMAFVHKDNSIFGKLMLFVKRAEKENEILVNRKNGILRNLFLLVLFLLLAASVLLWINYPHLKQYLVPNPAALLSSGKW